MVILDTNVIIDHLRRPAEKQSPLIQLASRKSEEVLAISLITIQELYEGRSTRHEEEERLLLAIITPLKIIPYTYEVAQLAGTIARDLPHPIEFADAAIAATALVHNASLFTLNQKHFAKIKNLEMINID